MQKLFPYWFLLYLFIEPLFLVMCYFLDIERDGTLYKIYVGSIAFLNVVMFYFCNKNKRIDYVLLFLSLIIFALAYYGTSLYYGEPNKYYTGHFLRWGASCVPSVLMGITFVYYEDKSKICKLIPIYVILLIPFIAHASLKGAREFGQFTDEDSGLNYQLISYYSALLFSVSCYYLFVFKDRVIYKIVEIVMYVMTGVSLLICVISGGRGGFVLLCVYLLYYIYMIYREQYLSRSKLIFYILVSLVLFLSIANYFDFWNFAGYKRVVNPLDQQTGRLDDWQEVLVYFYKSPVFGNGLGSDFYTWGFYSHNIFVDFLAETGVLGFCLLCGLFIWTEGKIYKQTLEDQFYIFPMLFAIYGLIMNLFSGYWISAWNNWFAFGIAYGLRCRQIVDSK